jgi:MFS family permease
MQKSKNNLAILIGNVLDHYDTHIYTLLAPYIAQVFFPNDLPIMGQIKTYGIASIGLITRPLGAALFGRFASKIGPLKALRYSLIGVALSTFLIGLLPSYNQIGYLAPILLVLLRALQSIFASGENAIAGLYIVSTNPKRRSFFSSIYGFSTQVGIFIASKVTELISDTSDPTFYWRVGFILGFFTSIMGIYIRSSKYKSNNVILKTRSNIWDLIRINKEKILKIGIIYGFSYLSYSISFTIITSFLPLAKTISVTDALKLNTYLIIIDGMIVPIAGYLINFVNVEKFMISCSFFLVLFSCILLWILPTANLADLFLVRILLIIIGVSLSIALKIWVANITDSYGEEKYLINALGGGLGMEILGRSITFWYLIMFTRYGNFIPCIIYVILLGIAAIYSIYSYPKPE